MEKRKTVTHNKPQRNIHHLRKVVLAATFATSLSFCMMVWHKTQTMERLADHFIGGVMEALGLFLFDKE